MTDDGNTVLLSILNKSYRVNCPPEERKALRESARYVDERMYRIQRRGNANLDREQIAVMVALNVAHELLKRPSGSSGSPLDNARLLELENKLDRALVG